MTAPLDVTAAATTASPEAVAIAGGTRIEGRSLGQIAWLRLRRDRFAMAGGIVVVVLVLFAVFAPVLVRLFGSPPNEFHTNLIDPVFSSPKGRFGGISREHPLGVEPVNGRDVFSRILYGASGDWSSQYAGNPKFVRDNNLGIQVLGWGADWPSGFGFLSQIADGRAIKPNGGNYNNMELNDPAINALLDKGIQTTDPAARNAAWTEVDKKVMESGALLPFVYEKTLLYRSPNLTNVYVSQAYGQYDYASLGKKQ